MTSIERTAYPRFKRLVTALELAGLSPLPGGAPFPSRFMGAEHHGGKQGVK